MNGVPIFVAHDFTSRSSPTIGVANKPKKFDFYPKQVLLSYLRLILSISVCDSSCDLWSRDAVVVITFYWELVFSPSLDQATGERSSSLIDKRI